MKKICCIFNFASHYREKIYKKIESEFNCDFYFGDFCGVELKKIDYSVLNSFVKELKYISLFSHFNWIKGSVNLVFKNKYDTFLMVGEPYCLSTWFVLIFSKILKKKTYLWTHGWYGDESYIKGLIKKIFFKLSSGIFLYGEYAKQVMIKEGFKKDKLHVIANSLDYEKMVLQRNKAKSPIYINKFHNNNPTIFFIGRLGKNKKLELLIDAHKFAQEKSVNFNVVLIGDGEHKDYLLKKTKKLGTENNVWFYGACYDEILISELIYNADLCVLPGNRSEERRVGKECRL